MSSKRPAILMGILLALILGYVYLPHWDSQPAGHPARPIDTPPLPGSSSVSGLDVRQNDTGAWVASFDYFYTGEPQSAYFVVELTFKAGHSGQPGAFRGERTFMPRVVRGKHHASVEIQYPGSEIVSQQVAVKLRSYKTGDTALASQQIDKVINWPNWQTWQRDREFAKNTADEMFNRAVALIDTGTQQQLDEAKFILEKLIGKDAGFVAGYIELGRVAMKTNWSTQGLHDAENLLSSALQIQPDSVNAKILLGYVYAHQEHYAKAEALFAEVAGSGPKNPWLWANWGELLAMQGKFDQAIPKYREAIARPVTHDTYDRARQDAYRHLLALLERRKDLDGMESLYKQRIAEYGLSSCFSADYASFLLRQRGDSAGAIELASAGLNLNCNDANSRQVLGLAHYVAWADAKGENRSESLNQARIYLPAGPMPLYLLAASDRTAAAAKKLIATGEPIDQKDNEKNTALAYALRQGDLDAAKRLLQLGARPETLVGYEEIPVALMPVMAGNVQAIRMMQRFGADYSKLRYLGATAVDIARESGNSELLQVLTRKESVL